MEGSKALANLLAFLAEPFPPERVEFKAVVESKRQPGKAQVAPYVDARVVQERLDEAVLKGLLEDWRVEYRLLEKVAFQKGSEDRGREASLYLVEAVLTLFLPGGKASSRTDVGEGESLKAAYSDALKRVAVQFGVGRYLYRLEKEWVSLNEWGQISPEELKRLRKKLPRPGGGRSEGGEEPLEERLKRGDKQIGELLEALRKEGKAKEGLEVLMRHGYKLGDPGATVQDLDRALRVYRELKALLGKELPRA